ncbi:MAG: hypothetical protein AB7Q17_15865 [Phycisphaerae bacterium]
MPTTYRAFPFPVAASLLNTSTGVTLLPLTWPVETVAPDGVIHDREEESAGSGGGDAATAGGAAAVAFVETRRSSFRDPTWTRRVTVTADPADAAAFAAVVAALNAAGGGAGFIEWRHPEDPPETQPTAWRLITSFDVARDVPHQARFTFTLEEN